MRSLFPEAGRVSRRAGGGGGWRQAAGCGWWGRPVGGCAAGWSLAAV